MSTVVVPIAIGAVAVVLVLGLVNMLRGGDPHRSQKLMPDARRAAVRRHRHHHGDHLAFRPLSLTADAWPAS